MSWSPVVELRQYALRPGKRDVMIDLFESDLVEPQEQAGMKVIGTFRDLDDSAKFVWLRGFAGMEDRARGLGEFYGGPVWQANREAANATMVDSDDVLLLRPACLKGSFRLDAARPPLGVIDERDRGIVEATILSLDAAADESVRTHFDEEIAPRLIGAGAAVLACLVTMERENNFPALPVREGEHVLVWFAGFSDRRAYDAARRVRDEIIRVATGSPRLTTAPQVLRLTPTRRSLLTGVSAERESRPRGQ